VRPRAPHAAPEAPAAPASAPAAPPAPAEPKSKRGLVVGLISAAAVLVLGTVITLAVINSGAAVREETKPTAPAIDPGNSAIGGETVPQPTDGESRRSADGTKATFTWSNPEPADGDAYRYARSEQPDALMPLGEKTEVTIDKLAENQRQCVQVYIYRAGKLSTVPLEICSGS